MPKYFHYNFVFIDKLCSESTINYQTKTLLKIPQVEAGREPDKHRVSIRININNKQIARQAKISTSLFPKNKL